MPVTKRPCQDALYQGMNIFRDTMRPYIVRRLGSIRGKVVAAAIADSLPPDMAEQFRKDEYSRDDVEIAIDVNMFGYIIQYNWRQAFESEFDDSKEKITENFDEIRRIRNQISHPTNGDIPQARAEYALKTMARILGKIRASDESSAIGEIREDMLSPAPQPTQQRVPPGDYRLTEVARLIGKQLAPIAEGLRVDERELAKQTAQLVAAALPQPEHPNPEDIAEAMMRRLSPILTPLVESPVAAQTAIDAAVIERLDRLSSPAEIAEQAARKVTEAVRQDRESSTQETGQLRRDFSNLAQKVTEVLENIQTRPQDSQEESLDDLRQDFQVLVQQLTDAIENLRPSQPGNQIPPPTPSPPRVPESTDVYEPGDIEDNWKAVSRHLRKTRGKREVSIGGLLLSARPVDIWMDLEGEKLMLPYKSPVVLDKIQQELAYPEIKAIIAESIARHFGKPLEIEPILLNQTG